MIVVEDRHKDDFEIAKQIDRIYIDYNEKGKD